MLLQADVQGKQSLKEGQWLLDSVHVQMACGYYYGKVVKIFLVLDIIIVLHYRNTVYRKHIGKYTI